MHFHYDAAKKPMELKDWLRQCRVEEGDVPAGMTSKRPNDQRFYNFLFRWKFDQVLAELGGKSDFRNPHQNTDVKTVLVAVAVAVKWMNEHPECTAAAWLSSGIAKEWDYRSQGKGALYERASTVKGDPEYASIAEEYRWNSGMWRTEKVLLLDQVCTALEDSRCPKNSAAIKEQIGNIPWLRDAASEARKQYLQVQTAQKWQQKRTAPPAAEAEAAVAGAKWQKSRRLPLQS